MRIRHLLVLGLMTCLLTACGDEDEEATTHEQVKGNVAVDLPPKPNLEAVLGAQRTLTDGVTFTVTGLILDRAQHFDTKVQVHGQVREISPDCPFLTDPLEMENRPQAGKEGERETRQCKSVYITIADSQIAPKELLMVAYDPYLHPFLQPGMEFTARGTYSTQGAGFVKPRDGLIIIDEVLNMVVELDKKRVPTFITEPEEVARVKAEIAAAGVPSP